MKVYRCFALLGLVFLGVAGPAGLYAQSRCSAKASAADVQQLQFLAGQWQGQVVEQGITRSLQLRFREQNGQIMASVVQAGQLVPLTAQASLCAPGKFHFFGVMPTGENFRFNARRQKEQLVGTLAVGNSCAANLPAFTLQRAASSQQP